MKRDPNKRAAYKLAEVARIFGCDPKTIYRWLDKGLLQEIPVPGGRRMVNAQSVEDLISGKTKIGSK